MSKETQIRATISETVAQGIQYLIDQGEFASQAEYLRTAVKEDLRRRVRSARIEQELLTSIASGPSEPFDWDAIQAEFQERLKK